MQRGVINEWPVRVTVHATARQSRSARKGERCSFFLHLSEAALIEKNDGEQKHIIGGPYTRYHNVITMDGSEPYMMPHKSPLTLDTYMIFQANN